MPGKPLSNVDTAWLRMEEPDNLMMITGLMTFDAPLDFKRYVATIENTLLKYRQFKQCVIQPKSLLEQPYWEDDPNFDINYHVQRIKLPPPGSRAQLEDLLSDMASQPLDFSRPLWQFIVVENYEQGAAVISRIHHCIADGISLMQVVLSMADDTPDAPPRKLTKSTMLRHKRNGLEEIFPPVSQVFEVTSRITGTLLHESFESMANPRHAFDLAQLATKSVEALGRLVLRYPDPYTLFKGPLGKTKRAAWSTALDLKDVKCIGRTFGSTVNDVLLTAVTGALRRYMIYRGESTEDINIRAVVPVNLRPLEDSVDDLGNRFGLVFLSLPIGIDGLLPRLRELKRRMDSIKNTPEALVAFGILGTIGMAPSEIQDLVVDIFGTKGTGVMTNVPGPQKQLYMAGSPVNTVMAWVPQAGHLGLGVSIISYNGKVCLGIITDEGLVPDPGTITRYFQEEFASLEQESECHQAGISRQVRPLLSKLDELDALMDNLLVEAVKDKEALKLETTARTELPGEALPDKPRRKSRSKKAVAA